MDLEDFVGQVFALFFLVLITYAFYPVFGSLPGGFWYGILFLLMMIFIGFVLVVKIAQGISDEL
jgi:hypothetical protein